MMRPALTIRRFAVAVIVALSISALIVLIERFPTSELFGSDELSEAEGSELRDLLRSGTTTSDTRVEIRGCRIYIVKERTDECTDGDCTLRKEQIINLHYVDLPARIRTLERTQTGSSYPVSVFRFPHKDEYQERYLRIALDHEKIRGKFYQEMNDDKDSSIAAFDYMVEKYGDSVRDNATTFTYGDGRSSIFIRKSEYEILFLTPENPTRLLGLLGKYERRFCDQEALRLDSK